MKALIVPFVLMVAAATVSAQRHKLGEVNAEKPEGQLLQQIGQESDPAKKLALMEEFAGKYPQHEGAAWVYEQMEAAYLKAGQPDKAIAIGEKLIVLDPNDVETAHETLKAAEAKKDPDLILKWALITSKAARNVAASPQPKEEAEVEHWKQRVDYAKQVETYTDYSLYAASLQASDPQKKIALLEGLDQKSPSAEYVAKAQPMLFLAYRQANQNDKAVALAEKAASSGSANEDMLLVLADDALRKKNAEKVHSYSAKLIEMMNAKPKPDGVSDADWQNRKNTFIGMGHYFNGKQYMAQNRFAPADKELRAALPLISSNEALKPEVLFLLGLANYKMEKIQEAANFNR